MTESCAAGLPHSAIPVATVHTTTLLSSSLPISARYVPHGEKASPRTPTLCRSSVCRSWGAPSTYASPFSSRLKHAMSHRMIDAR